MKLKSKRYFVAGVLVISLFLPAIFTSGVYLAKAAKSQSYPNFSGVMPDYSVLKWIQKNIPHERILFVDGYLYDQPYSYLSLVGIQNYGLIVPVSPVQYKVHTPDFGPEMVNSLYTLNPDSLGALQIKYLFIVRKEYQHFSLERLKEFNNQDFFEKKYSDQLGDLYEVKREYYTNGSTSQPNLNNLIELIPQGSNIYIDYPSNIDMNLRSALMLLVKDHLNIYTIWGPGAFNYIETKILYKTPIPGMAYDYLLLMEQTDPKGVTNQKSQLIWQLGRLRLYQTNE